METKLYNGTSRNLRTNYVAIDPWKFDAVINKRGLTAQMIAKKLDYSDSALYAARKTGVFTGPLVNGLRTYFNIDPGEYQYVPTKEEPKGEPKPETVTVEDSALYATMKKAIMDAMADTTGFYGKWLHNIMKQAMQEALKG